MISHLRASTVTPPRTAACGRHRCVTLRPNPLPKQQGRALGRRPLKDRADFVVGTSIGTSHSRIVLWRLVRGNISSPVFPIPQGLASARTVSLREPHDILTDLQKCDFLRF